ncbi:MAG: DNA pilot protein [Microvirus sp.]|nr:MAG: DNA pilot protein [Microvirus sp.]
MGLLKKIGNIGKSIGSKIAGISGGDWLGAASSLAGGLFSKDANADAARQAYAQQKEFAQNGIRWRVADAKAAGLHPLFALGGNIPGSSPVAIEDTLGPAITQAGQNLSRSITPQQTPQEKVLMDAQLRQIASSTRLNDANAAYYNSLAAGKRNQPAQTFPVDDPWGGQTPQQGVIINENAQESFGGQGDINITPHEVITGSRSDPSTAAGANPAFQAFRTPAGKIIMPSEKLAESMEDMPIAAQAYFYYKNIIPLVEAQLRKTGPRDERWRQQTIRQLKAARDYLAKAGNRMRVSPFGSSPYTPQ